MIAVAPSLVRTLDADELDRVLIHEWAHVQRRDDLVNILQIVVRIIAGWHPALWWIDRRLRIEREIACDEITVAVTGSAKAYAECLLKLSSLSGTSPTIRTAPAIFTPAGLRARVIKIVSPHASIAPAWSRSIAAAIVASLSLITAGVGGRDVVEATALALPLVPSRMLTTTLDRVAPKALPTRSLDRLTGRSPRPARGRRRHRLSARRPNSLPHHHHHERNRSRLPRRRSRITSMRRPPPRPMPGQRLENRSQIERPIPLERPAVTPETPRVSLVRRGGRRQGRRPDVQGRGCRDRRGLLPVRPPRRRRVLEGRPVRIRLVNPSIMPRFAVALTLIALLATPGGATSDPARTLLMTGFNLSAADIGRLDRGGVVSRTLEVKNSREVATLGVVRINTSPSSYVERMADIATFKRTDGVLQVGTFSSPPQPEDVASLTIDEGDLKRLRACRVEDCDVQLSADGIERVRRDIDWRAGDASPNASLLVRRLLVDYVARYRQSGAVAAIEYADRAPRLNVGLEFASLIDADSTMTTYASNTPCTGSVGLAGVGRHGAIGVDQRRELQTDIEPRRAIGVSIAATAPL